MKYGVATLVRAPGVGLAFLDQSTGTVRRGYAIPGGEDVVRLVAGAFIERISCRGRNAVALGAFLPAELNQIVDILVEDWIEFTGCRTIGLSGSNRLFELAASFDLQGVLLDVRHDSASQSIDWAAIQCYLSSTGLTIRGRDTGICSLWPGAASLVSVFEVLDADDKVVSEGKGLSQTLALHSALGEAVERIVAQTIDTCGLVVATQDELHAQGLATPSLISSISDLFSCSLPLEWIRAHTLSGIQGAMPAELAYYPYQSDFPLRVFNVQHTSGLAAGATKKQAVAAGLLEAIETDAYWLSMRTHSLCGKFENLRSHCNEHIRSIIDHLNDSGIVVHAGLISFDWPLSIVHVVLETRNEKLPALSHGLGSGATHIAAFERALLEAIQVYSGLEKVCAEYWPQIALRPTEQSEAALLWSSRTFSGRILEMFDNAPVVDCQVYPGQYVQDFASLERWLNEHLFVPWIAPLGTMHGLEVVRVFVEGAVSPFSERSGSSTALKVRARKLGIHNLYMDPILT